ncbi:MAG: hypothetical protein QOJ40_1904 [Verrucomicrobiota bacterium]
MVIGVKKVRATTLNFYRQQRKDGGIRTGVEINGDTVFGRFERGNKHEDSALLWYVDIRCAGKNLPTEPEAARQWLLDNSKIIQRAFDELADDLEAGIDLGTLTRTIAYAPKGVQMTIACSAIRRLEAKAIAKVLRGISARWEELIRRLPALELIAG